MGDYMTNSIKEALISKRKVSGLPKWVQLEHYYAWSQYLETLVRTNLERRALQRLLDAWHDQISTKHKLQQVEETIILRIA